jgi:hypothetical protein
MESGRKMGAEKFSEDEDCLGKYFCPHMGLSESAFKNALMLEARPILGVQGSPPPLGELDA